MSAHRRPIAVAIVLLSTVACLTVLVGFPAFAGDEPTHLFLPQTGNQPRPQAGPTTIVSLDPWIEAVPDVLLLRVAPGVTLATGPDLGAAAHTADHAARNDALQRLGVVAIQPLLATADVGIATTPRRGVVARTYRLTLDHAADHQQTRFALSALPWVELVEPDYIARAALVPNDPQYAQQWALPKIGAPTAWDQSTGNPATVIALIDSGIDTTHPDLAGRLWLNPAETAGNGVDDDANGYIDDRHGWNFVTNSHNPVDSYGHGTQVAGVAAAVGNNGIGIAGLCWQCKLMIVTAMQSNGIANYSDVAAAVAYASSNGARVINLSLGGYADSALLRDAIREAAVTAVIVAGAGNDDSAAPFYPAAYPEVLAVAATMPNDGKAVFSNYGPWVDLAAPGDAIRTTALGGGYATENGTSLSAPYVAAAAALVAARHPTWSPDLIAWHLRNTAASIAAPNPTYLGQLGQGRLAAGQALTVNPQPAAEIASVTVDGQSGLDPAPGQSFPFVVTLRNLWLPGRNLSGVLSTTSPHATITAANASFGNIDSGKTGSNTSAPFQVTLKSSAPYAAQIPLRLTLSGDSGYSLTLDFSLRVRSAVETLGNTQYTVNTTWTSDKTYVLNGTVIVAQGVTLTIQPGTKILGNLDKFIRVDGTLIANGVSEHPIVFSTNSTTNEPWGGIRFTDTAADATFDTAGNYAGGSLLRHVQISHAQSGVRLGSRAPHIADSSFHSNQTSIEVGVNGNGGSPRIERNRFSEGGTGIVISGGYARIAHNTFVGLGSAILGQGSADIVNNVIRENTDVSISLSNSSQTVLHRNVITGNGAGPSFQFLKSAHHNVILNNGSGLVAGGGSLINIEGNLIAGNGGNAALQLELSDAEVSLALPALAYNPALNQYLMSWRDFDDRVPNSLYQRLSADGQTLESPQPWPCAEFSASVFNADRNEYLLVGTSWRAEDDRLCVQRLDAQGQPIGSSIVLTTGAYVRNLRVLYLSDTRQYAVFGNFGGWALAGGDMHVQWLNEDATPLGDPIHIVDPFPDAHSTFYDAAHDPAHGRTTAIFRGSQRRNVLRMAHFETPGLGASQYLTVTVDPESAVYDASIAYADGHFLTVWSHDPEPAVLHIVGQIMSDSGAVVVDRIGIRDVVGTLMGKPQIAYSSAQQQFLVVWLEGDGNWDLMAQRIALDGSLIGAPFIVRASVASEANSPALAYNSQLDEFLVTWIDLRLGHGLVYGQRISALGQLLDNDWTAENESLPSVNFLLTPPPGLRHNTVIHNAGNGIAIGGPGARHLPLSNNNLFANGDYDLFLHPANPGAQNFTLNATHNYWGVPANQIAGRIRDCTFDDNGCGTASSTLAKVNFTPALSAPDQTAPAFVTAVTMTPNPVGLQTGALTVDFSRPMRSDVIPSAHFHDTRRATTEKMSGAEHFMARDATGRLWFVQDSSYDGVRMYDGNGFTHYTTANSGLGNDLVQAIAVAPNGDVWFTHDGADAQAWMSRLRGASWITYTNGPPSIGNVTALAADIQGHLWVATTLSQNVYKYDGLQWLHYTKADGLISDSYHAVVVDSRGHVWFAGNQGLSVYDGVGWRTYNKANGLPVNSIISLFADSQGRVWVGFASDDDPNRRYVGSFDGIAWSLYGSRESGGRLSCEVTAFAEAPDGSIWMRHCSQVLVFNDGDWSQLPVDIGWGGYPQMMVDARGNLWSNRDGGLHVVWLGLDHVFNNVTWLSPTRLQANYDITAAILRGSYAVQIADALGSDDMPAYTVPATFTVAYAGAVSNLPPLPVANAQAATDGSLNKLTASWLPAVDAALAAADPILYRYAIGTAPRARDTVGWTYQTATSFTRTDLQLRRGQSYYVTVQARGSNGLWSADSVSNAIVAGTPTASLTPTPGATPAPTSGPTATPTSRPRPTAMPDAKWILHLPTLRR